MSVLLCPTQENDVIFTALAEDASVKWTQSQCAKRLTPALKWNTAVCQVGWQLKWSLNGMQPQRPVVLMSQDVTLDNGKVLLLQ